MDRATKTHAGREMKMPVGHAMKMLACRAVMMPVGRAGKIHAGIAMNMSAHAGQVHVERSNASQSVQ